MKKYLSTTKPSHWRKNLLSPHSLLIGFPNNCQLQQTDKIGRSRSLTMTVSGNTNYGKKSDKINACKTNVKGLISPCWLETEVSGMFPWQDISS